MLVISSLICDDEIEIYKKKCMISLKQQQQQQQSL